MNKKALIISLAINVALLILLVAVTTTFKTEIYSFSGKSEHITIEAG